MRSIFETPLAYTDSYVDINTGNGFDVYLACTTPDMPDIAAALDLAARDAKTDGDLARARWLIRQAAVFRGAYYDILGIDADD